MSALGVLTAAVAAAVDADKVTQPPAFNTTSLRGSGLRAASTTQLGGAVCNGEGLVQVRISHAVTWEQAFELAEREAGGLPKCDELRQAGVTAGFGVDLWMPVEREDFRRGDYCQIGNHPFNPTRYISHIDSYGMTYWYQNTNEDTWRPGPNSAACKGVIFAKPRIPTVFHKMSAMLKLSLNSPVSESCADGKCEAMANTIAQTLLTSLRAGIGAVREVGMSHICQLAEGVTAVTEADKADSSVCVAVNAVDSDRRSQVLQACTQNCVQVGLYEVTSMESAAANVAAVVDRAVQSGVLNQVQLDGQQVIDPLQSGTLAGSVADAGTVTVQRTPSPTPPGLPSSAMRASAAVALAAVFLSLLSL